MKTRAFRILSALKMIGLVVGLGLLIGVPAVWAQPPSAQGNGALGQDSAPQGPRLEAPGLSQPPTLSPRPSLPTQPGTKTRPSREGVEKVPEISGETKPREEMKTPLAISPEAAPPLSRIELAFKGIAAPSGEPLQALRQFGYNFFRAPVSTFAPVDDVPVGPDYVLGPGDDLTIYVWGYVDNAMIRTVDRNGQIFLPKVGALRVWGLSFSQADYLIRQQLARYFRGFNTSVTLGRLRTIRINIVGEVKQPGSYTIGGLSTLTNALVAAGGPGPTGSLRNIQLLRNNHTVGRFDFYDYLLRGDRTRDFRLASGDTIFVPPIGVVAGIAGEVKRPAIYELKGSARIVDLIAMAGGLTPRSYLKRVQVVRARPSAERVAIDLDLTNYYINDDPETNILLENGDLVRIFQSDPRIYNTVTVAGAVKYPGDYELKTGMRISELLGAEMVLPEAHLERVEIARRLPDFSTQIISVNLKQALAGDESQNIVLRSQDQITIRTERRAAAGTPFSTVRLTGEFKRPGTYVIAVGERLSSVIRRAGGFTERAYLKGAVFTRLSLQKIEQEQLNAFVRAQEEQLLASAGETVVGLEKEETAHRAETIAARRELLHALASRVTVGRMVIRLDDPDRLEGSPDDIVLEGGDALLVPQRPSSVLVIGAVRNATSVRFKEGADVGYYLSRVGGLTKQADEKEIHIVKADGSAVSDFVKVRNLEPGDTIIVPPEEKEKIRVLPSFRDVMTIVGQSILSLAALLVIF